jgi:2-polyprenyl-6-methoxyphenol hydroxylase-like FAD-dependent oxidoreductase
MTDSTVDVLIVGAGPTGLTLACILARSGARVRIVDALREPPSSSRGKGLQPRSLEMFDDLGIVERVIGNGVFGLPMRYYDETGRFKDDRLYEQRKPRPDAPYVNPLLTPQWRVEEALRAKLSELGVRVEYGVQLTAFASREDGITVELTGATREPTSIRVPWLVGCDGGKSTIRHLTQIPFLGETLETHRMLVGDVRIDGLDREHWHIFKSSDGFLALCPLPSTDSFQFQASVAPGQEDEPSLEVFQRITDRRTSGGAYRLADATWMSLWRANVRMVDRYRQGRVFLAGDAAHVHSPAGGQGMNTGIQDACNLGWKLAAVLNGADASLLDTYQEERLPIAASVLGLSTELMSAVVASGTLAFQRNDQTLQLGLGYRHSSLTRETRAAGEGLRAGDRAPDAPDLVGPQGAYRMFDLLRGPQWTLLAFGARWHSVIQTCVAQFEGSLRGHVIVPERGDSTHYVDASGHARAAYGESSLFVIRPDNYVGMATDDVNTAAVIEYLEQRLRPVPR